MFKVLKNKRGQGLIEYLVIVALIAVGSIAIVRSLGETVYVRFANITNALQQKNDNLQPGKINSDDFKKRGMDDFFKQAGGSGGFGNFSDVSLGGAAEKLGGLLEGAGSN